MLDRGLRRRFDPAVEREARARGRAAAARRGGAPRTCASCRPSRSTRRPRRTSTTRSRPSAPTDGTIRVWVHIADVAAHVAAGLARRPRGAPARDVASTSRARSSRCCPRRCPTRPARCVPGRGPARRHGRARLRRRTRACAARSTARVIRSDERLDYPQVDRDLRRAASARRRRGREPLAAAREVAAALEARRASREGALEVESVEPEFAFDREGHVVGAGSRASRRSRTG